MDTIDKTKKISRNLKNLYLDPNNYRFVDNKEYKHIETKDILDVNIQKRTLNFISGKNREGIIDLIKSFKANGFLEVDVIQLKRLVDNNYLVLEGNRRVTALKALKDDYESGIDIGNFDSNIFKSVPSIIHDNEDDETHRIIMGLKHISGNKKWPAINQAKLIYDYLQPYWDNEEYYNEENKLCESLGITKVRLRTTQRSYHLILQYKQSDYGDQFESDMYSVFEEITKRPPIKNWIDWDDDTYKSKNLLNLERLFQWISITEETDEEDYVKIVDPIITKSIEIRDLAKFINDEKALETMEELHSVAQGLVASGSKEKENFEKSIKNLKDSILTLDRLKDLLSYDDMEDLKEVKKSFTDILPKDSNLEIQDTNVSICFSKGNIQHFSSLIIEKYKIFNNFKLNNLNRINIFAGFNNTGKTTLLEAIYILTKQNNIGSFFEFVKLKNKLAKLNVFYLDSYLNENIKITGKFNNTDTSIIIEKYNESKIDKKDDYLASYKMFSEIDAEQSTSTVHTFKTNPLIRYAEKVEILCNSIFKSPYFFSLNEVINTHNRNIELKQFDNIIKFISEHIDSNINDISLTEKNDIKRFLVDSKLFEESIDITNYGEGLQRIFEIALAFAYCKNGVLIIDELETAIHYSLLIDFTKFIQELAINFNVQVFITSHSKECIDAFVKNSFENSEISAYFLKNENNEIKVVNIDGGKLSKYIDSMNFDLRGSNDE